jgi:hypothetical protein
MPRLSNEENAPSSQSNPLDLLTGEQPSESLHVSHLKITPLFLKIGGREHFRYN